jgi:hypothetical protein
MGSQQNFRYRVEERRTRQISGGGGGDKEGRRKGKKVRFWGCNKSIKESATQCTSIDMNLI